MNTLEQQHTLLNFWANGTDFVLDTQKSPKAEFARLAQLKRWVGGDANWRTHWQACFGEVYAYGVRRNETSTISTAPLRTRATPDTSTISTASLRTRPTPDYDLVDRMRRLSFGSDTSEGFSIISSAPSVQSLESFAGGVVVNHEPEPPHIIENDDSSIIFIRSNSTSTRHSNKSTANVPTSIPPTVEATAIPTSTPVSRTTCSPFWLQFPGFLPNPTVTFKNEFSRLAKHQAWDDETRRTQKVEALMAEVNFHYGTCMNRLESWQDLCKEVGMEQIPTSITQCRKALKSIYVNLFNVVDHRRNPDFKLMVFKTYGEFTKYTRKGRTFPRTCAKQGGFIKVFLKKI